MQATNQDLSAVERLAIPIAVPVRLPAGGNCIALLPGALELPQKHVADPTPTPTGVRVVAGPLRRLVQPDGLLNAHRAEPLFSLLEVFFGSEQVSCVTWHSNGISILASIRRQSAGPQSSHSSFARSLLAWQLSNQHFHMSPPGLSFSSPTTIISYWMRLLSWWELNMKCEA